MRGYSDIKMIASYGAGVILDADRFGISDMKSIVRTTKGVVIIKNSSKYALSDYKEIAACGKNVIFDLTTV